jgi:hypothetical protein
MSFDLMRRHRRKVEVPLAIFVVITFALCFGSSSLADFVGRLRQGRTGDISSSDAKLLADGRALSSAYLTFDLGRDATDRQVIEVARRDHHTPAKLAEDLGIEVSDDELSEEITKRMKNPPWNLKPLQPGETPEQFRQRYDKSLLNHGLSSALYGKLLRERLAAERLGELLQASAAASEAEMYGFYAETKQKVQVQYFQRRAADFLKEVEEASKKEAAEAAAPAKPEEKPDPAAPKKRGVTDAAVRERFDREMTQLKALAPREDQAWDALGQLVRQASYSGQYDQREYLLALREMYFSEERAQIDYLVALRDRFAKDVTVKPEDIDKHYKDNPDKFQEEPKAKDPKKDPKDPKGGKAGEADKPGLKPLDDKLREEIRKTLVERQAMDAAEAALKAAVQEYNEADAEKRPPLGALAAKHKLETPLVAGPAECEDLEAHPYIQEVSWMVGQVFGEASRRQSRGQFLAPQRTKADEKDKEPVAWVTVRMAKHEPRKLLGFEQAKAGLRERMVLNKALELAREAAQADHQLLVDGKLDPKLVRTSVLLGPDDETARHVSGLALAVGDASEPYPYRELLGAEADAEKERQKQKDKEREAAKKRREKPALADSYPKGYRVVILVERVTPTVEEFRRDLAWRDRWGQDMPSWIYQIPEDQRHRFIPPGAEWRAFYRVGWIAERYKRATPAPQ